MLNFLFRILGILFINDEDEQDMPTIRRQLYGNRLDEFEEELTGDR